MALLWRTPAPAGTRRGPKAGLDVDRIVAAAVAVADSEGLAALSMRRVAAELGVGAMTLYTHVPGKGELVDLMLDSVLGELYVDDAPTGNWRSRLEAVARAYREYAEASAVSASAAAERRWICSPKAVSSSKVSPAALMACSSS